jgi:hypothetical protein
MVNAAKLIAASPDYANRVDLQVRNAGILVVTFDQIADAPCAYKMPQD